MLRGQRAARAPLLTLSAGAVLQQGMDRFHNASISEIDPT